MTDDIGEMLGQNSSFNLFGKVKIVDDSIVIIPEVGTTEFSKYMGAFHSYGECVNLGVEHIAIFSYPIAGHARIAFYPRNEFYSQDAFYFLLMTVRHEDSIKNAIKRGELESAKFEIQPANIEADYGDI